MLGILPLAMVAVLTRWVDWLVPVDAQQCAACGYPSLEQIGRCPECGSEERGRLWRLPAEVVSMARRCWIAHWVTWGLRAGLVVLMMGVAATR